MNKTDYIFSNLKPLHSINDTTELCIFEPTSKLYISKKVDPSMAEYYKTVKKLSNPNIVKILHIEESGNNCTVIREYVSGESLSQLLSRQKTLPEDRAISIIGDILNGLSALHSVKIVHRDINPNNIIIDSSGNAVIIDFGIIRSYKAAKNADTVIMGTPGYAAPEQFGFTQSDARTDIYAVGILLDVMLNGEKHNTRRQRGKFGEIIKKCTEIDANNRYNSVDDILIQLKDGGKKNKIEAFFSHIPGLHYKIPFFSVLTAILYFFLLLFVFELFKTSNHSFHNIIFTTLSVIFMIIVPYLSFTNFLDIRNKIPFTKNASESTKKTFYITLGILSIIAGLLFLGSTK